MDFKDRYKFDVNKDLLGKGEFSRVFRARDTLLDRVVALKFFTVNASEKYQVLDEIKKVIGFEHPNLCKYYDVEVLTSHSIIGEQERTEIGIMEYLDAGDLKQFISGHPAFTDKLLVDVLHGLSYLHSRGIVHRDLKPQNILVKMVDDKPVAKITDFRNSKLINETEAASGALPGAIEYIAPELFNPKKYGINGTVAANLDLWSFGLLVYETIKAEPLFGSRNAGVSAEQIMANILDDNYLARIEAAPPKYRNILRRCLVKDASKRVQHAADLLPLLEEAVKPRPHVFVTQQAAYPKIIDHGDAKPLDDPEKETEKDSGISNAAPEKSVDVPVQGKRVLAGEPEEKVSGRSRELEHAADSNASEITDTAKVDVALPVTPANNRWAEEKYTNVQDEEHSGTQRQSDADMVQPASSKKRPRTLPENPSGPVKPFARPVREPRKPFVPNRVKTTTIGDGAKGNVSWKAGLIGLLLAGVFIAILFLRPNEDAGSAGKNGGAGGRSSASMLPQMVDIGGGVFLMGFDGRGATNAEKPVHPVLVSDFSISKYEVTIGEFRNFVAATGYETTAEKEGSSYIFDTDGKSLKATVNWRFDVNGNRVDSAQANLPVVHVSWYDAVAYCNWLSEKTGKTYRLPTEAEWEYATLGGKSGHFFDFSETDSLSEVAWHGANSENKYHQVGGKKPNALGLFDMIGNVYEWCADWYDEQAYRSGNAQNPVGPKAGSKKVIRGGSWYRDGGTEYYRPTIRFLLDPTERGAKVGFRVCASAGKK